MLSYYFDEHMEFDVAKQLKKRGINVLTAQEAGRIGGDEFPDPHQLAFATSQGMVLVTEDSDFERYHLECQPHGGIIRVRPDLTIGERITQLEQVAKSFDPAEFHNQLIRLPSFLR